MQLRNFLKAVLLVSSLANTSLAYSYPLTIEGTSIIETIGWVFYSPLYIENRFSVHTFSMMNVETLYPKAPENDYYYFKIFDHEVGEYVLCEDIQFFLDTYDIFVHLENDYTVSILKNSFEAAVHKLQRFENIFHHDYDFTYSFARPT